MEENFKSLSSTYRNMKRVEINEVERPHGMMSLEPGSFDVGDASVNVDDNSNLEVLTQKYGSLGGYHHYGNGILHLMNEIQAYINEVQGRIIEDSEGNPMEEWGPTMIGGVEVYIVRMQNGSVHVKVPSATPGYSDTYVKYPNDRIIINIHNGPKMVYYHSGRIEITFPNGAMYRYYPDTGQWRRYWGPRHWGPAFDPTFPM